MTKVIELALERVGDLWPEWSRSRHDTRKAIFTTISLNIRLIIKYGTTEDKELLFGVIEVFGDKLKVDIANEFPRYRKKVLQTLKKCA